MAVSTDFSTLYTELRKALRDPQGGGAEGATPRWTLVEKKQAINDAISDAFPRIIIPSIDQTSITLADGTFQYTLPNGLRRPQDLWEVWLEPDDTTVSPWKKKETGWTVRESYAQGVPGGGEATTLYLYVDKVWDDAKKLRLVYGAIPSSLTNDADQTPVPRKYILARAQYYLHIIAASASSQSDTELHLKLAAFFEQEAEKILGDPLFDEREGRVTGANWD